MRERERDIVGVWIGGQIQIVKLKGGRERRKKGFGRGERRQGLGDVKAKGAVHIQKLCSLFQTQSYFIPFSLLSLSYLSFFLIFLYGHTRTQGIIISLKRTHLQSTNTCHIPNKQQLTKQKTSPLLKFLG